MDEWWWRLFHEEVNRDSLLHIRQHRGDPLHILPLRKILRGSHNKTFLNWLWRKLLALLLLLKKMTGRQWFFRSSCRNIMFTSAFAEIINMLIKFGETKFNHLFYYLRQHDIWIWIVKSHKWRQLWDAGRSRRLSCFLKPHCDDQTNVNATTTIGENIVTRKSERATLWKG